MPLSFNQPDSILSTTLANYQKTLQDNVYKANPLLWFLIGKTPETPGQNQVQGYTRGQLKVIDGGESIVVPLMYGKNSTAKPYSKYGVIDTSPQEGITAARYLWKQVAATITISGLEERQNAGSDVRVINLLQSKTDQAEKALMEEIETELFSSNLDGSLGISGLQTLVSATAVTGGIDPTVSTNAFWQAYSNGNVGSFAAGGLDAMRHAFNSASIGNDTPDFIISDQATFESYEKVLQPQERFQDASMIDAGFQNLLFKGKPLTFSQFATAGTMYMLNSKYVNLFVHADANMSTTDFVTPTNQDAKTAKILFQGEMTTSNRRLQAILPGITA